MGLVCGFCETPVALRSKWVRAKFKIEHRIMQLDTPIQNVPRVGPIFLKRLKKMKIKTIEDLLFHFPHSYENFSNILPISKVKVNEICCLQGKVIDIKTSRTWKKKMFITEVIVQDKTASIKVFWFSRPYIAKSLKKDDWICLAGKVSSDQNGFFLSNPTYEKILEVENKLSVDTLTHTGRMIPVYPETEGLSSRWLRSILRPLLAQFKNQIPEVLPEEILKKYNFISRSQAIWQIHFPDSASLAEKARKRFVFEELFLIQVFILNEKLKLNKEKSPAISFNVKITKRFVDSLSYKLTDAQRKSTWQILKDMENPRPMSRLLEGDVGSGKTIVAVIAALNVVKAGYQVAFMAPTEILAKQHFQEVSRLLRPLKIRIALLTGKEDKIISLKLENETIEISRRKLLERTKKGEIDILIGTHSLIQDKVKFSLPNKEKIGGLGLCIVDEQHRFGVEQRAKLIQRSTDSKKRIIPHLLSMTATPIPRSLALTIYGDLDLSILDEMPKGRKKIITKVIPPKERNKAFDFIRQQVEMGNQAFIICPRIDSSGKKTNSTWNNVKAVKQEYEKLSEQVFPDLNVEMMHGKMKTGERTKIMRNFKNKRIDILISTSVVEVGIDIPDATVMMIQGAERFGLAQLHQFRGRVGRSDIQSYCFLLTDSASKKTNQRLKAIIKAEDGFELSEKDLEIRGPGSLYGGKQWGIPDLAMKNFQNIPLLEKTKTSALEILRQDPTLKKYPGLKDKLKKFQKIIHLE